MVTRSFDVFINFDGDCRRAMEFYSAAFDVPTPDHIMTYGTAPGFTGPEDDRDRVLYAVMPIFGCNVMFADCPSGDAYVASTNVALTLGSSDEAEIRRIYTALSGGGNIHMELGQTFFSDLYAMLTDKFGVTWQLSTRLRG